MAIDITVTPFGWDGLLDALKFMRVALDGEFTMDELIWLGNRALELARESISTNYPPASAPFEAPRKRAGELLAGLDMIIDEANKKVTVGTKAEHGLYLELGTSKMQARPFLLPAVFIAMVEFRERFPDRLRSVVLQQ